MSLAPLPWESHGGESNPDDDAPAEPRRAPLVLVADDSKVIRLLVREQLRAEGYRVLESEDGREALEVVDRSRPDALLLDVEMPVMGGFDVLRHLKQDPDLDEVPVVFLTARDSAADVVRALELGAHDYLRKPFEAAELIARVRAAVRVKALQDELRERNAELERMSRTDALTGLWNRRHLEEHLGAVYSSARRRDSPYGVLMIDIDRFKRVNDQHGHTAGDGVLREVAARLRSGVRGEDQIARWGGEEFLAVLPDTDVDGAATIAERLRRTIQLAPVPVGEILVDVSVSIGVAAGVAEPPIMVDAADRRLYLAKEGGRNLVVAAASNELTG
ncbi:MAG TPA: diguanylate cyclase [Actinomycetota bacterium]|jgi:diguanylate cyclase (GGDEF)-like protein